MPPSTNIDIVKGIVVLNHDGNRILGRYYGDKRFESPKQQRDFELTVFRRSLRKDTSQNIALLDGITVVYRSIVDLYVLVFGSSAENELCLETVLNTVVESFEIILRKNVEQRTFLASLDAVMLTLDEIVHDGVVLETNPELVVERAQPKRGEVNLTGSDATLSEIRKAVSSFLR